MCRGSINFFKKVYYLSQGQEPDLKLGAFFKYQKLINGHHWNWLVHKLREDRPLDQQQM